MKAIKSVFKTRSVLLQARLFTTTTTDTALGQKVNKMNQVRPYRADPKISLVIKSNPNDMANAEEKDRYNKQIRECALGLYKNYKKSSKM